VIPVFAVLAVIAELIELANLSVVIASSAILAVAIAPVDKALITSALDKVTEPVRELNAVTVPDIEKAASDQAEPVQINNLSLPVL
jgi:hypothetical protein